MYNMVYVEKLHFVPVFLCFFAYSTLFGDKNLRIHDFSV